jgi:hypothetical protein
MKEFADEVKLICGLHDWDWFIRFWKECAFGSGICQGTFWLFTGLGAINTLTLLLKKYLAFPITSNIADNNQQILSLCKTK